MPRPSLILPPGTVLGGYEIEEVLGIGGMAVVYRATQRSLGRPVALKVLNPRLAADETFRARFRREGAMVAALDHPSVVPVHDLGEIDGRLFLAMRLIEGETLADRLDDGGIAATELRVVLRAIANALDAAHAAGVLHRDVKPQNVLLADDGSAYLADFGVARSATSDLTRTREFFGSVSYVAPEQIRGEPLTPSADVYGLAVLTYECLTGTVPFRAGTDAGVVHGHLEQPPAPIGSFGDPAADALSRAVTVGLEKHPEDRPASAGGFVDGVEIALAGLTHEVRSRRPAFPPARSAEAELPLAGVGGAHPPRGGTQPIAIAASPSDASEPEAAPSQSMPDPEREPGSAPGASRAERRAGAEGAVPAPARRRRPRLPLLLAVIVATVAAMAVLLLPGQAPTTAQADVPRLAASGAPEQITRAARTARERALARERAAAQARRKAAEARRKAAARRAAARKAASAGNAGSSESTSGSAQQAPSSAGVSPPSASRGGSSGAASSGGSTGSGGSSSSSGSSVCDFPPC